MKDLLTRRAIIVVCVLFFAFFMLFNEGHQLETASDTWSFLCRIEDMPVPDDIIQMKDTMVLVCTDSTIHLYESCDGCTWSEIESPVDHDMWLSSVALFKTPDHQLGIVWQETDSDKKEERTTFFWSIFDDNIWSEPKILFNRDEYCIIGDALMREDGSLLLLWNESLPLYIKDGERTIRASGCRITYRAYIHNDNITIEQVIEPENTALCYTNGFSFIENGGYIWCVFEHGSGTGTYSFYRSWSKDGKTWSPPEVFEVPDSRASQIFSTPQGEIGVSYYKAYEKSLFLYRSTDWEHWSQEKLITAKAGIVKATLTEGTNGMWGIIHAGSDLFFICSQEKVIHESQEKHLDVSGVASFTYIIPLVFIVVLIWRKLNQ
jgi:hypothetical protein